MALFLGLDSSTQSLSAIIIDSASGEIVLDQSVSFGDDLPQYESPNGFLSHPDPLVKHSNPLMWVAALDLLLSRIADGFDLGTVKGVSGSGQQHGSVYLNEQFSRAAQWRTDRTLAEQVALCLSRDSAPIWMDSSTTAECEAITAAAGGRDYVVSTSGSAAIERFTGPQIGKFYHEAPDGYARTSRIHLVSSFMASVLCGHDVPIDQGDGAGMNLMSLATADWDPTLLTATAPDLRQRLPRVVDGQTTVGTVAPYFCSKYGFCSETPVIVWSGDNPSSLVGMGAIEPGTAVMSLGTSDTYFAAMADPLTDPCGYGHVFGNPAGGFMSLICFKNGSLAREDVQRRFDLSWAEFSDAILMATEPGNGGNMMLPYFVPEITPRILSPNVALFGSPEFVNWQSPALAARAVVEAQALSMKLHSAWIGDTPNRILVTGGASRNRGIMQVLADVFHATLERLPVTNSAALGAALRAANAVGAVPWSTLFAQFAATDADYCVAPSASPGAYQQAEARFRESLAGLVSTDA